jgi:hypothetical protein
MMNVDLPWPGFQEGPAQPASIFGDAYQPSAPRHGDSTSPERTLACLECNTGVR